MEKFCELNSGLSLVLTRRMSIDYSLYNLLYFHLRTRYE